MKGNAGSTRVTREFGNEPMKKIWGGMQTAFGLGGGGARDGAEGRRLLQEHPPALGRNDIARKRIWGKEGILPIGIS